MPQVSILSIGKQEGDLKPFLQILENQTFKDFEIIFEETKSFPEAWELAIQKAKGEILVFLEAGSVPVDERWLEELIQDAVDEKTIVKGLEICTSPLNPSSLAGYRTAFLEHPFDESFFWAEDSELFCRLKANGYNFKQLNSAPVVHFSKPGSKTYVRRAFRYGLYRSRLRHRYSNPVELADPRLALKLIIAILLAQIGIFFGFLYSNISKNRK